MFYTFKKLLTWLEENYEDEFCVGASKKAIERYGDFRESKLLEMGYKIVERHLIVFDEVGGVIGRFQALCPVNGGTVVYDMY